MCGCGGPFAVIVSEKVAQYTTSDPACKRYFGAFSRACADRQSRFIDAEL
jgi:hypothetical protein